MQAIAASRSYPIVSTGTFLSEDPIGLAGGINPYTFGGNDPVNYRDPLGLVPGTGDSATSDSTDWRNLCPRGGTSNLDGTCTDNEGKIYDADAIRSWLRELERLENGPYVAPDLVHRGWFTLDYTDQHGHLVIFNLEGVLFEKIRTVRDTDRWVDATYRIVGWDSQSANVPNTVLLWANRVPIRSTLRELSRGNYTGGFVQNGRAGGRWYHP